MLLNVLSVECCTIVLDGHTDVDVEWLLTVLCVLLQELIRAQSSSLAPLFDKGAHVYVCGDAKVRRATPPTHNLK